MGRTGRPPVAPERRFFELVRQDGECWIWTGTTDRSGYGSFWHGTGRIKAHRWAFEFFYGAIPDGLQIDHLCRRTSCVNPQHMDPVDARTNTLRSGGITALNARKTACKDGHPLERRGDRRICPTCAAEANRRYKQRKRTA